MRRAARRLCALFALALAASASGQKLPTGEYRTNRERSYDLVHLRAELGFDFEAGRVAGRATLTLEPLEPLSEIAIDAILLEVEKVTLEDAGEPAGEPLAFEVEEKSLVVTLPAEKKRGERFALAVDYAARPRSGMYFQRDRRDPGRFFVSTYGEGGLHANWLPIYGDVNDKYSTEMLVTVPAPYVAISNGKRVTIRDEGDGRRTFHWLQELPHAGYLISIYVGDFEEGRLEPALGAVPPEGGPRKQVPQSFWVPRGRLADGAYAFRNSKRMVDHFSKLLDYPYPWDKHDQVAVPDYAIGAMEHTGVTGHNAGVLRTKDAPVNFRSPDFSHYHTDWTAEKTIAHELAHHWFGNNVTCRNLAHLWLNESFASYLMMLWDEEAQGRDLLDLDVDLARRHYFDYVAEEHVIRPLEHHHFDDPETIFNTEHTYLKGAAVLHMLRGVLGDVAFFRSLAHFLDEHEYGNVESADLRVAIEEAAGRNLGWFFDDWIAGGGGHPMFEVSHRYLEDLQLIDLEVRQVQPWVEGQDLFRLPVEITVATPSATRTETVWVEKEKETFLLASPEKPEMVSFDGRGWLVAEVRFDKELDELVYQAANDAVPGRLWALRQLAARFPARPKTLRVLGETASRPGFWGLKAEAALLLGAVRTPAAEEVLERVLKSPEYRVRKAAVLALPRFATPSARELLLQTMRADPHPDVVATAIVGLAKIDPTIDAALLEPYLERESWMDEIRQATLSAFEDLGRKELAPTVRPYTESRWNQDVRQAAFSAWQAADSTDPELHAALLAAAGSPPYALQQYAIEKLGELYVSEAVPLLEEMVELDYDRDLAVKAKTALEEIRRIRGKRP